MNSKFRYKNPKKFNRKDSATKKMARNRIDPDVFFSNESKSFQELSKKDVNKSYSFRARIEEIKQTSGPTVFTLYDASSTIKATAFVSAGKRAFPELQIGDIISTNASVSERDSSIEIEMKKAFRLEGEKKNSYLKRLETVVDAKSKPVDRPFLIKSDTLDKLRPEMMRIAAAVRKAIFENRPIILRHHADCDGYSGAFALEQAILPLIKEQHGDESAQWHYFTRSPSKAPFYEYTDVVRDLSFTIENMARFGQKAPLVLLVDNGSTEEDLLSIRKLRIYDVEVCVVDHHYPGEVKNGKVLVDDYVKHHVNPYKIGSDMNLCAGILATELARMINDDMEKLSYIPALAATGDRSKGEEIDKYFQISEKMGFTREYLKDLAECIDFEAHYIRFMESRGLVADILGKDLDRQKKIVSLLIDDIKAKKAQVLEVTKHYAQLEELSDRIILKLDADKVTSRGDYPAIGKTVGMTHDHFKEQKAKPVISLGLGPDFVTIRVSDGLDININSIVKELKHELPNAAIDGGGHEHAGTVKFMEAAKDEVLQNLFAKLKK